ncbi:nucleotide sugar dehydrogenase [Curtobacterium albidum]|uniref:nucleotide sugar dehydrogenase n=1 Tax=Curtobacterium citreum TaxID=2036 RepID=UPI0020264C5C|nr:nucleotide sugar dehydrogenase [Curtobacterium albidum]MCL9664335.1 nucleotide sugar dehydrogenase [Curtobacterium albidum]
MNVVVVGLGKIGLPLAVQYAGSGASVTGLDVSTRVVDAVNAGTEPFPGEAELAVRLRSAVASGRLCATVDAATITAADVVVVVVPLVVDGDGRPDFTSMDGATASIGKHLRPGTLVVYETTLPVGTTRGRWLPRLEAASGLVAEQDFHVVFSPERVLTGRVFADLRRYPKLVGAVSPAGAAAARRFYEDVLQFDERPDLGRPNGVWDLGSTEAAELAKLAETTYRDVNIALANEFARFADDHGIDVAAVITACNSQPYSQIHRPGIAVGGHCIPVYPRLYLWNDPEATVVRAARERNTAMPEHAVGLLERAHGSLEGQRVVVLGAAYRGGVKETAFSGVFATVDALRARGAIVTTSDPLFPDRELAASGLQPHPAGSRVDAAIVQADHAEYTALEPTDLPGVRTIVDGRRVLDPRRWSGVTVLAIGSGGGVGRGGGGAGGAP